MPAPLKNSLLLTCTAAWSLCSCAVKDGRLDFTWWQDAAAPVLQDDVIIEAGGGGYYRSTPAPAQIPLASLPKEEEEQKQTAQPTPEQPATVATAAQPAAPAANGIHTVQAGDTLTGISRKYGTTVAALVAANGMANADVPLRINQQLKLPTSQATRTVTTPAPVAKAPAPAAPKQASSYTVKAGDTLYKISRQYGIKPADLMQANSLTPETANKIRVGATLRIPAAN
jgi:LysM repeat protein